MKQTMGKCNVANHKEKGSYTKLLYKKSNNTIFTHSRTCSGVSQLYSRSAVLQIKRNLQESSNYYNSGGKIRRDLSLETDICVLRRYYKNKRYKTSTYDSSAKSRYSTVIDTEVETIEEFPDTSACGDNDQADIRSNPTLDIATLMIDNLKDLLSQWFQRHLVDNDKNREKIDTVIEVLLSQLEQRSDGSSSYATYIVHRAENNQRVKDKKIDTQSFTFRKRRSFLKTESSGKLTRHDSSIVTIPFPHMISTLSIPRSFNKQNINKKKMKHGSSLCKLNNIKHKDLILTFDPSNKCLASSSLDLLDFSNTSRSKHVDANSKNKMTQIIFKPVYKSATNNTSRILPKAKQVNNYKIKNVNDIPKLLKSLYTNDPANITSTDKNYVCEIHRHETFTMTDNSDISKRSVNFNISEEFGSQDGNCRRTQDSMAPTVTIGFMDNTVEFPNTSKPKARNPRKANTCNIKNKTKINTRKRIRPFPNKFQGNQNKQFTFLYNKANNHSQGRDFLKHCRSVFEYFVNYDSNRNIKLDIQVNVLPIHEEAKRDASTVTSTPKVIVNDVQRGPTLMYNVVPKMDIINTSYVKEKAVIDPSCSSSGNNGDLITLLDGAVSQSKYIFGTDEKESELNITCVDRSTITSELQIVQEISELRSIIKDLVLAAEKLVNENLKRDSSKLHTGTAHAETSVSQTSYNFSSSSKWGAVINLTNLSKAIQCSNDSTKNPLLSGFKLSKEPKKKDYTELTNRLMKKSTSYRIIDSESILRVTDMTSNNKELDRERVGDEALSCSLPKSRSLFEMTTKRNKRKLMAFFCDGTCGPTTAKYEVDDCYDSETCAKKWIICTKRREGKQENSSRPLFDCSQSCIVPTSQEIDCESSAYSQAADDPEANKCTEHRQGMSFCEGCFYCTILWIPVIFLVCLFYVFKITETVNQIEMERDAPKHSFKNEKRPTSPSRYPKRMPTYVVAFSVQESYDDPVKPQVIENTRSIQRSIDSDNSVSSNDPTDSSQTLITHATEESSNSLDTLSEVKINIPLDNDCGDVAASPEIDNYVVVENNTVDRQPQVLFNAIKHKKCKKFNNQFLKRRSKKCKRVVTLKKVHFKCKHLKNNVSKRLYKYSKKAKKNSSLSKIVSRVLKKVSAKANLLDNFETSSTNESFGFDGESLNSSACTENKSFISHSSQNTLVLKSSSSSSRNDDWYSINTTNSVIHVCTDVTPYKTDVINVSVAVAYNPMQTNIETENVPSNDNLLHNASSTSNATFLMPNIELTSLRSSTEKIKDSRNHYNMTTLNGEVFSVETLKMFTKKVSLETASDDDAAFEIARTSSEFNKSSIQSDVTLITNSENTIGSENISPQELQYDNFTKYTTDRTRCNFLDTVLNLGLFPEISPATSSAIDYDHDLNVIVTENVMTSYSLNPKNKKDDCLLLDMTKGITNNVLKKSCQAENNNAEPRKNINLPNEAAIKAIFKESEKLKKTNSKDVVDNYSMNTELWDRLIVFLDIALKRLEDSLAEKIIKDLKSSFLILFDQFKLSHDENNAQFDTKNKETKTKIKDDEKKSNNEVFVETEKLQIEANRSVQCDIVQNKCIDNLMLKLSVEEPRVVPECSDTQNVKKPKIIKNYFKVLKPPVVCSATDVAVADIATVSVSTATPGVENEKFQTAGRFKQLIAGPSAFVRENVFVITSVPAFLFVLLCFYSMIVLIIKPW